MSDPEQPHESSAGAIDNKYIARIFHRIANMLEFMDGNPFKVRSYRSAGETLERISHSVAEIATEGGEAELQKLPGIGKSISSQIVDILRTGSSPYLEELAREVPVTVLDLRRIPGIGLKTAQVLHRNFGIASLKELREFAAGGGLLSVPGLGEKSAARILNSLAELEREGTEE